MHSLPLFKILATVSLGASLGACSRWALCYWFNAKHWWLACPLGTLIVNLLAGFLMGVALAFFAVRPTANPLLKHLLITGFLGAFSTISAVVGENLHLLQGHDITTAVLHLALHVFGCYGAMLVGYYLFKGHI